MSPINRAAVIMGPKSHPFVVTTQPYPSLQAQSLIVRSRAVAINPIDYKLQQLAVYPLQYPTVLGVDVAGEVVEVGDEVKDFRVGDRVLS